MIKESNLHELHLYSGGGDQREVYLCLSRGTDPNLPDDDGWSPLHWACYRRQSEMVSFLIERGAALDLAAFSGDTPLHACATEGSVPCLRLVLDAADAKSINIIDTQNNIGYNPLMWTAAKGHLSAAKYLLGRGADLKAQNQTGDTALHIAANNAQLTLVEFLLKRGADVDATNNTGDTALHGSAMEGHVPISKVLLKAGAGDQLKNSAGQRPIDLAKFWGNDTMVISKYAKERNRKNLMEASAERDAALSGSSSMSPEALRKLEAREAKRAEREAERQAAEDGARERAEAAAAAALVRRAPKQKYQAQAIQTWGKSPIRAAALREEAMAQGREQEAAEELAAEAAVNRLGRPKHTDPDIDLPSFKTGGMPLDKSSGLGLVSPAIK